MFVRHGLEGWIVSTTHPHSVFVLPYHRTHPRLMCPMHTRVHASPNCSYVRLTNALMKNSSKATGPFNELNDVVDVNMGINLYGLLNLVGVVSTYNRAPTFSTCAGWQNRNARIRRVSSISWVDLTIYFQLELIVAELGGSEFGVESGRLWRNHVHESTT